MNWVEINWIEWLAVIFLLAGSLFILIGALGLLRMNSFWLRAHTAGLIDTPGIVFMLLGVLLAFGSWGIQLFKIVLLIVLIVLTGPTIIHMICQTLRHQNRPDDS